MITAQQAWHNSKEKQNRKRRMVEELEKLDKAVTEASLKGDWQIKYNSNIIPETIDALRGLGYEVAEVGKCDGASIYEISWTNTKIDPDDDEDK